LAHAVQFAPPIAPYITADRARAKSPLPQAGEGQGEGGQMITNAAKRLRELQTDAERLHWQNLRNRHLSGRNFRHR
ncbi:MAG: DUF559 domain-containing protein, partial [Serratia inhibens]|uniref:DUF559 domain-containing protein n=1 Tax=Serratia inhibens TaxID=2338073 RepID=UPI003C7E649D